MLYIAAMATAITACSGDEPLAPEAGTPITVSATMPGDVWAVASRTNTTQAYSNWTLHYTNYKGEADTYKPTVELSGISATFTTGSELVWAQIKDTEANETFYLTCKDSEGATFYTTTSAAHGAETINFATAMTPVVAKFTVNFTFVNNLDADADDFAITFSAQGAAAYNAATHGGACPTSSADAVTSFAALTGTTDANSYIVTGTILLPAQTLGNVLTVTYNGGTADVTTDDISWNVDLSTVSVGSSGQKANQRIAGQHLTLNISASYTTLNAPSIEVEAFTTGSDYESDLGGVAQQPSTNP